MNIKNSWMEFRIWLGCNGLLVAIMAMIITLPLMLTNTKFGAVFFYVTLVLFVIIFILSFIAIFDIPRNWRVVIKMAKKFKKQCTEEDKQKIEFLISGTKTHKDGRALNLVLKNPEKLNDFYM